MKRLGVLVRPLFAAMLLLTIFACNGGGCSGCAGCGLAPIPGAFPLADRIPNAAQVRLSESGIGFIEDNISPIVSTFLPEGLDFRVNTIRQSVPVIGSITICEDDDCGIHIEIASLELLPQEGSNVLRAHIRVRLNTIGWASRSAESWDGTCDIGLDSRRGSRDYIGLTADILFENITEPARVGYTKIRFDESTLGFSDGEDIEGDDIRISGGFLGSCGALNLGFIKNLILDQLQGQFSGLIQSALGDQLCTQQGEFGCPTGTVADGTGPTAVCRYTAGGECVPTLLGTDGRGDLGASLLGGFSPGTHAPGQFVLASGGDGEAVNDGMSLFMVGGFMSMDRTFMSSPGHNPCVPVVAPPPLPDVARVAAFRGNVIPGTSTETHVGIGLSEDYLDYAGYGLFDSGMLCIGAGTRLSQQLSTGLVSGVAPSLANLAFPSGAAPLTLAIRPQLPPDFTIGTDESAPLLTIALPQVQIDFYVWSTERYVRFMTYQADLTIRIDLTVEGGQIVPRIEGVDAANSMVLNSEMLTDNPEAIARALEGVLSTFAGMLGGAIAPVMLPAIMGFELDVPMGGVRGVADGGERFLGIFANLRLASSMVVSTVDTTLSTRDLALDPESMTLAHWSEGDGNSVWLDLAGQFEPGTEYEYSHRLDGMTWSHWSSDSRVQFRDDALLLQARHVIEARARRRGEPLSADPTPARVELLVDISPPTVELSRDGLGFVATAADLISPDDALRYRFRVQDGVWGEWQSDPRFTPDTWLVDGGVLGVEVIDESGNTSSATLPLIRGLPNASATGGCGCMVPGGAAPNGPLALVGSLLVLGAMVLRRRRQDLPLRRVVSALLAASLAAMLVGCECGGGPVGPPCNDECIAATPPALTSGAICCPSTNECAAYDVDALCEPGFTCPTANVVVGEATCVTSCSMCMRKPPLQPGILATDLDLVVGGSAETYVSGYSPGVAPRGPNYGDLVFGTVNAATGDVAWEIVDGAPEGPIVADPDGWRGGVQAPGDDVGRWTSMADSGSTIYIAYYDATHGALKLATGSPGAWTVHTVDDTGDAGRYASLVLLEGGVPAIGYLRIEPSMGGSGPLTSAVQVAVAGSAMPGAATDWTLSRVASGPMACRPQFCPTGTTCLENGECVATTAGGCSPACPSGQACAGGSCQAALPSGYVEDVPPAFGLHVSLARTADGLGIVWYDRSQGNLWGAASTGASTWGAPLLIDGYARADATVGDSGLAASLFVDAAGTWHVTYVDGAEEALRYATVRAGAVVSREVVDDGMTDGTTRWADGRHVVGDDSSVVVTDGGEVRVAYMDGTSQHVVLARRASGATGWSIRVLDDMNHTGFWVEQVLVGGTSYVGSWWRQPARGGGTQGVRILPVD